MGVKGLWNLLEPTGKIITMDDLAGKVQKLDLFENINSYF